MEVTSDQELDRASDGEDAEGLVGGGSPALQPEPNEVHSTGWRKASGDSLA